MKKYISYLLTLALLVPVFDSCTQERDFLSRKQKTHTVHFATSDPATRTGLTIEDNMVKPDWRKTDLENIHFFEIDATNAAAPGTADEISLSDDNRTAHFKAAISEDVIIHIDQSTDEEEEASKGTRNATRVSPFTYAAVVAQKPNKDAFTFVIPSEQHPDAATLKDPNAEFLVGYSRKSYDAQYDYELEDFVVDLYFDRVAALGRLAISGFVGTGEKVKSVTITATDGMTGKATYPDDFTLGDKNKVNFTKVDDPLVLNYGENGVTAPAEGTFYAYFVAAPGEASVTSIEVLTDQYKYTKTVVQGAKFTFSDVQLLNIDFTLSEDIAEAVTPDNKTWYKASVLEDGIDYIIVSEGMALQNNDGTIDAVALEPHDGIIALDSAVDPTIVWKATAVSGEENTQYGTHRLSNNGYDIHRGSGNNASPTLEKDVSSDNVKRTIWSYDGEYFWNISIYTSGSSTTVSTYYLFYDSSWKQGTSNQKNTDLYETRPPIEVSFASAEAKYDLDNEEWTVAIPELTAPEGADVTYSSSNEDIATVAADGTVTPKAAGSVRITATVAGDDEHQGGSAYYELVVTTSKIKTWYKAEKIVAGETYLVISHNYALNNNGTSGGAAVLLEGVGETVQYNAPETMIWTATNESSGKFRLTGSDGKVIRLSSNSFQIGSPSGTESNNQWSLDANGLVKSGNYFLYYSTGQSKWAVNNTASESHTGYLYTSTPPLASRNLSFSAETVTHDLADGEDVNEPELTGDPLEGVTYASENKQIATVDANTGAVTLTGKTGSVIITASAPKTNTYKAESVSYTLIVKNGALGPKTYHKVTAASDLVVGARYLLVYEAGPFVFMPILEESGTSFSKSNNTLSVEISSNTITSAELGDYELALSEGYYLFVESANRYLYPYTADSGRTTAINAEVTPEHALTITISSGNTKIENGGNYLNYSTNNGGRFSSTASSTLNVSVYKLDEGGTTPGGGDDPTPTTATYTKVNTITSGATYLIVSPSDDGLFTGTTAGGVQSVTPENDVITSSSYSNYEFVITEESSGMYSIKYQGQYLYCNGNFSGTNATAIGYQESVESLTLDNSQISDSYAFGFKMNANNSDQFLYFKSSTLFKWGGSGKSTGVHLYEKTENP